ncbi:unnamed protein product [Acanthoscelides obtectus]|uniref:Uncharacterized protein n=1 Tax=Acanthoscelides obtectus TaxID=200917 RepID=A0A9P0P647_ACAOB|nr:unnamed protein product [Acanthoscelides obtectus]CAK1640023.1 hypothetical protein AOBTE_LOCUS11513 [Acanthoscelides obtectus]
MKITTHNEPGKKSKVFALNPRATKGDDVGDKSSHDHRVAALEVCDNVVNSANDRFQFKDYLVAASLFFPEHFGEYCVRRCVCPGVALRVVAAAGPPVTAPPRSTGAAATPAGAGSRSTSNEAEAQLARAGTASRRRVANQRQSRASCCEECPVPYDSEKRNT